MKKIVKRVVIGLVVAIAAYFIMAITAGIVFLGRKDKAKWDYMSLGEVNIALSNFYQDETNYPPRTVHELHELGVLHDASVAFLSRSDVTFHPFSSSDLASKPVIVTKLLGRTVILTKADVLTHPMGAPRPTDQITIDFNRVLSSAEKSVVMDSIMHTIRTDRNWNWSSIEFTTHTICDVQPVINEQEFAESIQVGTVKRTGKRRYTLTLFEDKVQDLLNQRTTDSTVPSEGAPSDVRLKRGAIPE